VAVTLPLGIAFMESLKVTDFSLMPSFLQERSTTLARGPQVVDMGPFLWAASFTTKRHLDSDIVDIETDITAMDGSIGAFYAYDVRRKYPKADPTGSTVGSAPVKIKDLSPSTDKGRIKIKGLPSHYVLSKGDYLAFDYNDANGTTCRALHRFLEGADADGEGDTDWIAVRPHIRDGAAVDANVDLKKPSCLMRIVAESLKPPTRYNRMRAYHSFDAIQVPRP